MKNEVCLHFSSCYDLQTLNLDIGINKFSSFFLIITNYFDTFRDLQLPKVYKQDLEQYYDEEADEVLNQSLYSANSASDDVVEIEHETVIPRQQPVYQQVQQDHYQRQVIEDFGEIIHFREGERDIQDGNEMNHSLYSMDSDESNDVGSLHGDAQKVIEGENTEKESTENNVKDK